MKNARRVARIIKKPRAWIPVILIALTSLLAVQQAIAGSSNTIPKYGFLGNVTAYANVQSYHIPESYSNGWCSIKSYTSPSTNINVIGWTWWQCDRLLSDGSVLQSIHTGGSAPSGSSHEDAFTWVNAFSQGVTQLKAHGVHDFNHTGSNPSPWRPYNVNVYP